MPKAQSDTYKAITSHLKTTANNLQYADNHYIWYGIGQPMDLLSVITIGVNN